MTIALQNDQKKGNKPSHGVYVETYIDGKPVKVRIASAWKHSRGNGFNTSPIRLVMFEDKPNEDK